MARVHTHYDNLKIARDAPPEVIRAAYKALSQKHHPDRNANSPDAIRVIQIINLAYEVLSDPTKRREHDDWIARTEAESQDAFGRSGAHYANGSTHGNTTQHTRRQKPSNVHHARYQPPFNMQKAMQKAWMMLNHFSRLFKKR
jgi:DnaJ-class molecular chaperone